MTCRHKPGDPNCSSHPDNVRRAEAARIENEKQRTIADLQRELAELRTSVSVTPDSMNYIVEDVEQVGPHLVLRVRYPNCSRCAYEGLKTMVFLNVTIKEAFRWKLIDPHFRATAPHSQPRSHVEAPSPAARFPGNDEGWQDALRYARLKASEVE